jgi:RND family efflux transporter MFP subunit
LRVKIATMPEPLSSKPSLFRRLLPCVLLLLGLGVGVYLVRTAPKTVAEPETKTLKTVLTLVLSPSTHRIHIEALGNVIPAKQVTLSSEVAGRVVRLHDQLVAGGHVRAGDEILGIDDADYQINLSEQKAVLAEAQCELELEQGRKVVAAREWEQLKREMPEIEVNQDLVLRVPHQRKMEATIARAASAIAKAELDLRRTSVIAPFNALVLEESVELGQLLNVGDTVASVAGADEFWVQTSVRQDELPRIQLPTPSIQGAPAKITLETGDDGVVYQGEVIRLLSDLEPNGRNARVIVRIKDPLSAKADTPSVPLLLRSFVRVEIDAGELADVIALDRPQLHEGDQVWVVDASDALQIRQAEVLWKQGEIVYVANCLEAGDRIVMSSLRSVVPGTVVEPISQEPAAN